MKSYKKHSDGTYHIKGKKYDKIRGSRAEVMHGTAYKTTGGLTKDKMKYNKHGRIVSRALSKTARKDKRLVKAGYLTKKGVFGAFKNGKVTLRKKQTKRRKK